jgi:3-hydroxyisobutyrate dehydrogenase-like beta-hydroxyacid dehydrogenase
MIATRTYEPVGFTVALGLKDLGLAEQAAADTGTALPTSSTLRSLFESALADEDLSKLDWSAVAEVTRRL